MTIIAPKAVFGAAIVVVLSWVGGANLNEEVSVKDARHIDFSVGPKRGRFHGVAGAFLSSG